jgi:hypothetical protein
MRRTLASTVFLGALALAACGDDSSGNKGDASTSVDGSTVIDAAVQLDARPIDAARADAGPIDAAGTIMNPASDAGAGSVTCGTMTCDQATQECCVTVVGMAANQACVTKGTCAGAGTINCDGPEDCDTAHNQVCCAHFSGTSRAGQASCKTYGPNAGECSGDLHIDFLNLQNSSGDVALCHTPKQSSTECPSDKRICQQCSLMGQNIAFCTATPLPSLAGCPQPPP